MIKRNQVESGLVPRFLFEVWNRNHNAQAFEKYVPNEEVTKKEMRIRKWAKVTFFIALTIGLFGLIISLSGYNVIGWQLALISLSCFIVSIIIFFFVISKKLDPKEEKINNETFMCISDVNTLFETFRIEPSKEIGRMSLEEFRANVEDALKEDAYFVDSVKGFNKVSQKVKFAEKHKIALGWGLCHKDHSYYYPKK